MKRIVFEFFLALLLVWPGLALADDPLRVIVFGDSLVSGYQLQPEEGFTAQLDRRLKQGGYLDAQVTNMAVAGETAGEGLERLPAVLAQRPDLVVMSLGTNDALRGIPVDQIYKYVASIAKQLTSIGAYVVILEPSALPSMGDDYARRLDAAYRAIPHLFGGVQLFPASESVTGVPDLSLADSLHPNARGVQTMVERMFPLIDGGLRWRVAMRQYQQKYQQGGNSQDFMPKGGPPPEMR